MNLLSRAKRSARTLTGTQPAGRGLTVYPDDVFLVSYPRSGNTWMRFLVGNLLEPEEPVSFGNLESRIPDIQRHSDRSLRHRPRPRVLKSHEYFDPRYRRVLYVVRDPRDIALSYYRFQIKVRVIEESFPLEQFVNQLLRGTWGGYGSWSEHVGSWVGAREGTEGFLLLRYEDVLREPEAAVSRIGSLLGLTVTPTQISQVVELSSSARMRELEKAEGHRWKSLRHARADTPFVGPAEVGRGARVLPPGSVQGIDRAWGTAMERVGYAVSTQSTSIQRDPGPSSGGTAVEGSLR